jgi:hypothetical protein
MFTNVAVARRGAGGWDQNKLGARLVRDADKNLHRRVRVILLCLDPLWR